MKTARCPCSFCASQIRKDEKREGGGHPICRLVVVGKEDILSRVAFSEQLVQGIRGAELVVLEKCGHGLPTESPEATAAVLLGFLSRDI